MENRRLLGWRSLQTDTRTNLDDTDDEEWTPLSRHDYVHLGITIGYQCLVLLVVLHLWLCRTWPPYIPRQISLVCLTGVAGVVAYIGALVAYGVVERHEGDFLASCGVEGFLDYYGWGIWTSVALVRVYRSWKILVRHSVDMWPAWGQVLLISTPWLLPVVVYTMRPSLAEFNERGNWCDINRGVDITLYIYGCAPILGAFFLSYQMRRVRKQMNFFRMQVFQLMFLLLIGTVAFPLLEGWLQERDDIRRAWIMYDNVVSSLILFWPPIVEPLYRYIKGDNAYLHTYTKGFSTLPTPSQMRSSLQDQLSLEDLRKEFEKFADSRIARELPDFYKACLDREEIEDFFKRQAVTTAIIDRFVREGSEQQVNLSGEIRTKILSTEITSYNIFNDAMASVLKMMDNNFSAEFKESEAYRNLEKVVEEEAEELERLRRMRQLPPKEHVENDAKGLLKLLRRVSETVGNKSSKDSSSRQSEKTHSSSGLPRDTSDEERCSIEDISFDANGNVMRGHDAQELHEGMVLGDSVGAGEEASREDNISDDSTVPRLKADSDVYQLETRSSLAQHEHHYEDPVGDDDCVDPELGRKVPDYARTERSSATSQSLPPSLSDPRRGDPRDASAKAASSRPGALPPAYPRDDTYSASASAPLNGPSAVAAAQKSPSPGGSSDGSSLPSDIEAPLANGERSRGSTGSSLPLIFGSHSRSGGAGSVSGSSNG
ncbi:unnamed protein product, partial [Ascophyllum nodosum]